jgi:hypothetical protein
MPFIIESGDIGSLPFCRSCIILIPCLPLTSNQAGQIAEANY